MRARGFTILELMVSLALSGVLLAGAFQLHTAFSRQSTRQQQVADMQQSLRVSRQILERWIRGAGAGLEGNPIIVNQCNGPAATYYPLEFSNSNAYVNIRVAFDNAPGDTDADPDWIRIVGTDPNFNAGGRAENGANVTILDKNDFAVGDDFIVVGNNADPAKRQNCSMEITHIDDAGGNKCPTCGALQHNPGQSCMNVPPGQDNCLANVSFPALIRKISGGIAVFRVETTPTAWCTNPPCLGGSFTKLDKPPAWQMIAEGIEDLQVALIMKDGRVCGSLGNSIDSPVLCPPAQVSAVRFTLTARSSSPVTAFLAGQTIGAEDLPGGVGPDGYLRRSVTSIVQLRNQ
jgi:prepilin-type N-terminal cleavage/methylation domain-containing protein